jgi:hypothetical protein
MLSGLALKFDGLGLGLEFDGVGVGLGLGLGADGLGLGFDGLGLGFDGLGLGSKWLGVSTEGLSGTNILSKGVGSERISFASRGKEDTTLTKIASLSNRPVLGLGKGLGRGLGRGLVIGLGREYGFRLVRFCI